MKYRVHLIEDAEQDLLEIFVYGAQNDSIERAEYVFKRLKERCDQLKQFPHRGHIPTELHFIGIQDFLEVTMKPYRIMYQILDKNVLIHCILDGRRDMQTLLNERMLRK